MLGLSGNAFARLEKTFTQTGPCGPVFYPVLCSEGPSMAVTCSAHAMSHVKVHHGPPPGHWNGRWRRGTTLKIWHPAKMTSRGCGLCEDWMLKNSRQITRHDVSTKLTVDPVILAMLRLFNLVLT